jgi:hypothetical protein
MEKAFGISILTYDDESEEERGQTVLHSLCMQPDCKEDKKVQASLCKILTLCWSQLIWETHSTVRSVPCHPYAMLNLHIPNSFLTLSGLSNPHTQLLPRHSLLQLQPMWSKKLNVTELATLLKMCIFPFSFVHSSWIIFKPMVSLICQICRFYDRITSVFEIAFKYALHAHCNHRDSSSFIHPSPE